MVVVVAVAVAVAAAAGWVDPTSTRLRTVRIGARSTAGITRRRRLLRGSIRVAAFAGGAAEVGWREEGRGRERGRRRQRIPRD